jgi:WD40 repeat protein
VWDTQTGKKLKELDAPLWDLSPDGKVLAINENFRDIDPAAEASVKRDPTTYTMRLIETATWKEITQLHEKDMTLQMLRFTPDSRTLALAASDYTIRLWDWLAQKESRRFRAPEVDRQKWAGGAVTMLAFNPAGTLLASVSDTVYLNQQPRKIDLWEVATGNAVRTLPGPEYPIMSVGFTAKGDRLAVSARQNVFNLFDVTTGKKLSDQSNPCDATLAVAVYSAGVTPDQMPNGPGLLTRLWNLASGEDILSGKLPDDVEGLTFSPDDRTLLVGDRKGIIRFYDLATGNNIREITAPSKSTVHGLTYLQEGKVLCAQNRHGLSFLNLETGKPAPPELFPGVFYRPAFAASSDGKLAAAGEDSPFVLIWPSATREPRRVTLPQVVRHLQFTPDGKKLVAGSWEGVIQVIDADSGKLLKPIGWAEVAMFALSPDGKTIAAWHRTPRYEWDKHVTLWNLDTGEESGRLPVKPSAFTGMHFTSDGKELWLPHEGGIAQVHPGTGQIRVSVQGGWPIALSNNGRFLACKGGNVIFVWDVESFAKRK